MGDIAPIDVGATIEVGGHTGRVENIWIDEDGVAHVTINWTGRPHTERPAEKVTYEDVREMMKAGECERTNTGHEAWQWRVSQGLA